MRHQKQETTHAASANNILPARNSVRAAWLHIWGDGAVFGQHRMQMVTVLNRFFPELMSFAEKQMEMIGTNRG